MAGTAGLSDDTLELVDLGLGRRDVGDRDVVPVPREAEGDGLANALASTGDECDLVEGSLDG